MWVALTVVLAAGCNYDSCCKNLNVEIICTGEQSYEVVKHVCNGSVANYVKPGYPIPVTQDELEERRDLLRGQTVVFVYPIVGAIDVSWQNLYAPFWYWAAFDGCDCLEDRNETDVVFTCADSACDPGVPAALGILAGFSALFLDYGDPALKGGLTGTWLYIWFISMLVSVVVWFDLVVTSECDSFVVTALSVFTASWALFPLAYSLRGGRAAVIFSALASVLLLAACIAADIKVGHAAWLAVHTVVLNLGVWPRWGKGVQASYALFARLPEVM